ncbi:MAG: AAA family ATPase [Mollicutes bacterium]|nr:AAA family ATPase [Mollicutes bacterium]
MFLLKDDNYDYKNFIETIGMPASGKSTLVKNMMKDKTEYINVNARYSNNKHYRKIEKILNASILFIKHPMMVISDTKIIISSGQRTLKDLYSVLLNWLVIIYTSTINKDKNKVYIWDQGIFQAIWSIYFSGTKEFDYIKLLKNKNLPYKIYLIDVNDEDLARRASNRGSQMRLDYDNNVCLKRGRVALEKTIQTIKDIGYIEC